MIYHFSLPLWQHTLLENPTQLNRIVNQKFFEQGLNLDILSQIQDCEILTVFVFDKVTSQIMEQLPNLKLIVTRSTGFDHIDLEAARARNIVVKNVPNYGSETVAEFAFGLLLSAVRHIPAIANCSRNFDFDYSRLQGLDLNGKVIGIFGSGKIGRNMIQIAKGFDMKVLVYDIFQDQNLAQTLGFEYCELDQVLSEADILSLHLPFSIETKNLLSRENLIKIKKACVFINVARGNLITNENLVWALDQGVFSACGLDTLEDEEKLFLGEATNLQRKILENPNVIFSPHCAYYTQEAVLRILETTTQNIKDFENGKNTNQVS